MQKTIRIKGLKRTGLHMGYYTFAGTLKNCYVHYFANSNQGVIAFPDGSHRVEFNGLDSLKRLIETFPNR